MVENVDVLIFTSPCEAHLMQSIFHGINSWVVYAVDRKSLQTCALLEKEGYSVGYIPFNSIFPYFHPNNYVNVKEYISKYKPRVIVGIPDFLNEGRSYLPMLKTMEICKELYPDVLTFVGGAMVSTLKEKVFDQCSSVDGIITDETIINPDLLPEIIRTSLGHGDFSCVEGIIYRSTTACIISNFSHGIVRDTEKLPIPSYHLIKKYEDIITFKGRGKWFMFIRTSYGCPYHCIYCSTNRQGLREMRYIWSNTLRKELDSLFSVIPKERIFFDSIVDDLFGFNLDHAKDIMETLQKYDIQVRYILTRANLVNEDLLKIIKGVVTDVLLGAENVSDHILDILNKNQSIRDIIKATQLLKKQGFKTHLNWMVGLPGEDLRSLFTNLKTMAFLIKCGLADVIEPQVLSPFPWTEVYQSAKEYGLKNLSSDWALYDETGILPTYELAKLTKRDISVYYLLALQVIERIQSFRWGKETQDVIWEEDVEDVLKRLQNEEFEGDFLVFKHLFKGNE